MLGGQAEIGTCCDYEAIGEFGEVNTHRESDPLVAALGEPSALLEIDVHDAAGSTRHAAPSATLSRHRERERLSEHRFAAEAVARKHVRSSAPRGHAERLDEVLERRIVGRERWSVEEDDRRGTTLVRHVIAIEAAGRRLGVGLRTNIGRCHRDEVVE